MVDASAVRGREGNRRDGNCKWPPHSLDGEDGRYGKIKRSVETGLHPSYPVIVAFSDLEPSL